MSKILIETLASTSCDGTCGRLPDEVRRLAEDIGADIEFTPYKIWDMTDPDGLPDHITERLAGIKNGEKSIDGLFICGEWFDLRPHNAGDVIKIRRKLKAEADLSPDPESVVLHGQTVKSLNIESSSVNNIQFSNSVVPDEMGYFSTDFGAIWFFEGSIKKLNITACPVEDFTYNGYDINKLIEIAGKHPELFKNKETGDNIEPEIQKADINDIMILPLTLKELDEGSHPCFLCNGHIDRSSKTHRAAAEKFGGWGYKAAHGPNICGWIGVLPKDVLRRDRGWAEPCGIPDGSVLYLTCYLGGGTFGPQYNRIGIARKLIMRAVSDAKERRYLRVEAYPHPEVVPVLLGCGFTCEERANGEGAGRKHMYLDI